jgi:glucose-6-phosphate 1-dehydrogenase
VRVISHETLGVEGRGGYFDNAGILKDMVQNHLLQMLALVAMEPPVRLDPASIRDEKVKVLKALRPFTPETAMKDITRGQYGAGKKKTKSGEVQILPAYRSEDRVDPDSNTETYVLLKTWVDNVRWGGVPFYLESGKRMSRKETSIIIQFKPLSGMQPYPEFGQSTANRLVFSIAPREGFHFAVNGKRPDADWAMDEVIMEYCQSCRADNNSPEAYERLLLEAYRNNASLFARWDELYYSWRFIDAIRACWETESPDFPNYEAGTDGPDSTVDRLDPI